MVMQAVVPICVDLYRQELPVIGCAAEAVTPMGDLGIAAQAEPNGLLLIAVAGEFFGER